MNNCIAIIAGTGQLPIAAARSLHQRNAQFISLCLFPDDNAAGLAQYGEVITQPLYKLSGIIKSLKQRGITSILFIGKVDKRHLLKRLSYDWLLAKLLAKAVFKNDSDVMQLLINELATHGIDVISQREVLTSLFIPAGTLCGTITNTLKVDLTLGMQTAEKLSQADIGQTVVVKDGMVLAVEAIEGTDECIARGISLGSNGVTICKTARKSQSDCFDIPTLGPDTIKAIAPGTVAAIAWHANRTMIADIEQFVALAKEKGITLVSL